MPAHKKSHPTIALFLHETFGTYYQLSILSGAFDAARHYGASLVVVCGSEYDSPRYQYRYANLIYHWVDKQNVDGIILPGSLFNYVDEAFQRRICDGLKPLPLRVLGKIAADVPNTVIDNISGLRDLVRHLIEQHGYRRLAFVSGPVQNKDAGQRYDVYREVLAEYKIPFDPALVVPGGFMYVDGQEAVRILWDERKVPVDVIVAGNDDMALGILDALRARGIRVPEQVAVTGFDDSDEASTAEPPLTTVRQPVYKQAYQSVGLLLENIRGEPVPETLVFPTEPVYRRSCGCFSPVVRQIMASGDALVEGETGALRELLFGKQPELQSALRTATADLFEAIARQADGLMQAFIADLQSEAAGELGDAFLLALENGLRVTFVPDTRNMDWHVMISSMRHQLLPVLRPYPAVLLQAETLWQTGHVLVSERLQNKSAGSSARREVEDTSFHWMTQHLVTTRQEMENNAHRWIMQDLITTFDEGVLMDVLAGALPTLGVQECYVAVYEDVQSSDGPARLILSYRAGKRKKLAKGGQRFASPQALLGSLLLTEAPHMLVMESLNFRDEYFGFAVFGLGDSARQVNLNVGLWESVSGGLKGARLAREVQNSSTELENAYQILRKNQEQLIFSEKMASLGRLTAGIAHEMNTPLAAVRAALNKVEQLIREYEASIGDKSVTDQDHHTIASELHLSVRLADKAAERAAGFVRGIKSQTRGLSSQVHQSINAVVAVEDALLLLSHALREGKCALEFKKPDDDPLLVGVPGRLEQVVTNLVNNAIDASQPRGGPIVVSLNRQDNFLELQVIDHGCGIPPENLPKIFDPMFSTKPFGSSTGLGLTIVHDIVSEFGGSIGVESQDEKGATFTIHIPLEK